ncbi:hypothetical protein ABTM42_20365, partial [Acinetobacter baumannii]
SVQNDGSGNPTAIASFTFNADGSMPSGSTFTIASIPGGKNGQPLTGVPLNLNHATEYSGSYAVTDLSGGGYAQGNLSDFVIETDGTVT